MKYNKLINLIYRDLPSYPVSRKYYSIKYISSLFNNYDITEIAIFWYCCFGDEKSCWIDIIDKKHLFNILKNHSKQLYRRKIFIQHKNDGYFTIIIPLRDLIKCDLHLVGH